MFDVMQGSLLGPLSIFFVNKLNNLYVEFGVKCSFMC